MVLLDTVSRDVLTVLNVEIRKKEARQVNRTFPTRRYVKKADEKTMPNLALSGSMIAAPQSNALYGHFRAFLLRDRVATLASK